MAINLSTVRFFSLYLSSIAAQSAVASVVFDESANGGDELTPMVVSVSRQQQALSANAVNTYRVETADIRFIQPTHVQETLVAVPGVNLDRGNGQEYLPAVRSPVLTGAGGCGSVLSTLDGVPLRAAGFCNINELFEAPHEYAGAIEVIRGPGSAVHGSNAVNGVINVLSPSVAQQDSASLAVVAGPNDYAQLHASGSQRLHQHGMRADMLVTHDGGYRDDSGYDQQKLSLKHQYSANGLTLTNTLHVTHLNQETAGFITGEDAYKDDSLIDTNPTPEAYRDASSLRLASRVEYDVDQNTSWQMTAYYRNVDMNFLQHFLPGDPLERNGHQSIGLQSIYFADVALNNGHWSMQWRAGIDWELTQGYLKQTQDQPTQGSAFLMATIPVGEHYDYQVDAIMIAPFMHMDWSLSERWGVNLGVRYESMNYDYDNRMLSGRTDENGITCGFGGCRYSRPDDREDTFENWSPKFGVRYQLTDSDQIYMNLSHGFRAPQATELYRLQRDQVTADLDSEALKSIEFGIRGHRINTRYELIAFAMEKDNIIFRDSAFFNVSNGEIDSHGVELSYGYLSSNDWDLSIAATYAKHEYANDRLLNGININGNQVDSAPQLFGRSQIAWNLHASLRIALEWVHLGDYYTDPENLHDYQGHDIFNLRGRWMVTLNVAVTTKITNLSDQKYAERADFSSFSGDRYFPGQPRALYMGISVSF